MVTMEIRVMGHESNALQMHIWDALKCVHTNLSCQWGER